ncbi:DUF1648 domain-containing protein [Streptomyces sp. NPDC047022]|uniref:DUF1648 domain-containing protein n=1 Tax=Streptomyces sp. NPDC047022 TaxID=3155737 RepID=UPI0033DC06BE
MNDRNEAERGARWGTAVWTAGTAALIAALPWAASGRLPDRLATHWSAGRTAPDSSMPLWAASLFPALMWLVLAAAVTLTLRQVGAAARTATRRWTTCALLSGGVLLCGAQASIIRANLDREDWHQADLPNVWIVAALVAAGAAGIVGWLVSAREQAATTDAVAARQEGPTIEVPADQRLVWFSRTANPWIQLGAAVTGLIAVGAVIALVSGIAAPGASWALLVPFALASIALTCCASVQARVSEQGLAVAFGPLGRPVRRWQAAEIESARAEYRTPAQAGGWGYRLSGLGTTVMLRGGECLVIRTRGKGKEFAVSVDDAERGAALLNSLNAPRPS